MDAGLKFQADLVAEAMGGFHHGVKRDGRVLGIEHSLDGGAAGAEFPGQGRDAAALGQQTRFESAGKGALDRRGFAVGGERVGRGHKAMDEPKLVHVKERRMPPPEMVLTIGRLP